ncbi:hypothetical protein M3Y96_00260700 [Aphelenchoides besseyi]|nr:hypothetical protein M3Y96_00260700 [Aphelenchoides besseyi]
MKTAVVVFLFWILSSAQNVPAPAFIVANPSSRNSLILRTHGIITSTKGNESKYVFDQEQLDTQRAFVFSLNILPNSALYVAAGRQRYYNLTKKFTFFDRFVQKLPVRFGFDIKMPATSVVVVFKFSEIVELEISSRSKQKAEDKKTDDLVNGIVPALLIGIVPLVVGLLVIYHYTRIRTRTPPMSTVTG